MTSLGCVRDRRVRLRAGSGRKNSSLRPRRRRECDDQTRARLPALEHQRSSTKGVRSRATHVSRGAAFAPVPDEAANLDVSSLCAKLVLELFRHAQGNFDRIVFAAVVDDQDLVASLVDSSRETRNLQRVEFARFEKLDRRPQHDSETKGFIVRWHDDREVHLRWGREFRERLRTRRRSRGEIRRFGRGRSRLDRREED